MDISATKLLPNRKKSSKFVFRRERLPTSVMVNEAITNFSQGRKGLSLYAIKQYMSKFYYLDAKQEAPFIKRYLKNAVERGILVQTKGKGVLGSFQLASAIVKRRRKTPKSKVTSNNADNVKSFTLETHAKNTKTKTTTKKNSTREKATIAKSTVEKKSIIRKKPVVKQDADKKCFAKKITKR